MDWFYAEGQERRGPVSAEQMQTLLATGKITPETRVWNSSFTDWRPLRETALSSTPPSLAGAGQQRCIITGKTFPTSQMIQTEHGWVSAEGRDTYYQCLREGAPFPVPDGMSNARADGKRIVVPVANALLPRRCIKTNRPVTEAEVKLKTLYWCTPWIFLGLLLNLLVVIILHYVLRKKVPVEIPLSAEGRAIVRKHTRIAWGIALVGIALILIPIWSRETIGFIALGFFVVLAACIYANFKVSLLRAVKLKDGEVWFVGACPEFVASLPAYGR